MPQGICVRDGVRVGEQGSDLGQIAPKIRPILGLLVVIIIYSPISLYLYED